jgi:hypothetical protein
MFMGISVATDANVDFLGVDTSRGSGGHSSSDSWYESGTVKVIPPETRIVHPPWI